MHSRKMNDGRPPSMTDVPTIPVGTVRHRDLPMAIFGIAATNFKLP
jgi:hypothetical protein